MAKHMWGTWETISNSRTCPAAGLINSHKGRL